jgi:hypothetical protein
MLELDITYKSPVRLVLTEAPLNAGQVVEPCSDTQPCWAMATGSDAARRAAAAAVKERIVGGLESRRLEGRGQRGMAMAMATRRDG